jgi:hypothetical protein
MNIRPGESICSNKERKKTFETQIQGGFPRVTDTEIQRFVRNCGDPILIREKAAEIRIMETRYTLVKEDARLCIIYLKEKNLKSYNENIAMAVPILGMATQHESVMKVVPQVQQAMKSANNNAGFLAEWAAWLLPPPLTLRETKDDGFIIPKDEKTILGLKKLLTESGVDANVSSGIGDFVSNGIGVKTGLAAITSVISYMRKDKPIDATTAVAKAKSNGW